MFENYCDEAKTQMDRISIIQILCILNDDISLRDAQQATELTTKCGPLCKVYTIAR